MKLPSRSSRGAWSRAVSWTKIAWVADEVRNATYACWLLQISKRAKKLGRSICCSTSKRTAPLARAWVARSSRTLLPALLLAGLNSPYTTTYCWVSAHAGRATVTSRAATSRKVNGVRVSRMVPSSVDRWAEDREIVLAEFVGGVKPPE